MTTNFDSIQTLKSSENCYKFSKSVSYETLVAGTATTGREYKQTRRLFLSSADKPLSAVGTLTSLLCNSAKVMEKWLQISPVLRLVKVLGLVAVLSFTIITESRADCRALQEGWVSSCKTLEPSGTCGTGCSYTYNPDTKTVYITATGNNARIGNDAFRASSYENNSMPAQTFVINGAVKIGMNAFTGSSEVISGANGALILTGVEHHGFGDSATLYGTIIIPEGATFGSLAFHGVTLADDAKIYCGVENCKQKMIDSCNAWGDDENDGYRQRCLAVVNNMGDKLLAYPDGCTKMGASGCTKCKNENFKLNDGECDRLRWTPAEAAKVLTDDNNNSVTITFRK